MLLVMMLSACSERPYSFAIDYPIDAARLSLGGTVVAKIDCDTKSVQIISDTSNGIFSRHISRRVSNICYNKSGIINATYNFDPVRGPQQNLLATQPNRRFTG